MTRFTLIVSTASKPLRGRLNSHVTMMGIQVMMTGIHTESPAGARGVLASSSLSQKALVSMH